MRISEKLKDLRIERNLYQKDIANAMKVNQSAVAKWEKETNIPNVYILIKLAKFYKISFDELLEDVGDE